jgi:hypothetical protein
MAEQTDMRYFYALGLPDLLKPLKAKPQQMVDILVKKRKTFYEISSDPWVNAAGMTARRQQATDTAQQELDQLAQQMEQEKTQVEAFCRDILHDPTPAPEVQLARETRAVRLWERFRGILDSGHMDVLTLIEREKGNLESLGVLKEELPDWLLARNEQDAAKGLLELIDRYERPLLTPAQRDARDALDEVADGYPRLVVGLALATDEIQRGNRATVLPAWESRFQKLDVWDDTPATGKFANQ